MDRETHCNGAKHNGKADKVQYGGQANQGVCLREEKIAFDSRKTSS